MYLDDSAETELMQTDRKRRGIAKASELSHPACGVAPAGHEDVERGVEGEAVDATEVAVVRPDDLQRLGVKSVKMWNDSFVLKDSPQPPSCTGGSAIELHFEKVPHWMIHRRSHKWCDRCDTC